VPSTLALKKAQALNGVTTDSVTDHTNNTAGDQLQALSTMCVTCRVPGVSEENEECTIGNLSGCQEIFL
jgi:hypothetical protein